VIYKKKIEKLQLISVTSVKLGDYEYFSGYRPDSVKRIALYTVYHILPFPAERVRNACANRARRVWRIAARCAAAPGLCAPSTIRRPSRQTVGTPGRPTATALIIITIMIYKWNIIVVIIIIIIIIRLLL